MVSKQPISLVITVRNEQESITDLMESIVGQSRVPDELIIVDGNSTDATFQILTNYKKSLTFPFTLIQKKSNISQGRNHAIESASHNLIAITDAGCRLDSAWLEELERCYLHAQKNDPHQLAIIAGYYRGDAQTLFEQAQVPYVLVMPDQVNPDTFLPATRSMLLPKQVWQELGGFNERLVAGEDYDLARKIKNKYGNSAIHFCAPAVVYWRPRSSLSAFFLMIRRMAASDIQARNIRSKVLVLFGRYLIGLSWLMAAVWLQSGLMFALAAAALASYLLWAIAKNFRYVGQAWWWLPVLQVVSDLAVMLGSVQGLGQTKSR